MRSQPPVPHEMISVSPDADVYGIVWHNLLSVCIQVLACDKKTKKMKQREITPR